MSQDKLNIFRPLDFDIINPDEVFDLDPVRKARPGAEQEEPLEAERHQDQTGQQGKNDEEWRFLLHSPDPGQTIAPTMKTSQRSGGWA